MSSEYLAAKDIALLLGVSENYARKCMREMPHARIGNRLRVFASDFDDWFLSRLEVEEDEDTSDLDVDVEVTEDGIKLTPRRPRPTWPTDQSPQGAPTEL